ncbi:MULTISPECIES: aspartate aminotransferase family protein [Azotobacter]|nr:aminotransferase class III-fold pyridoxal phosphate-dependent enzyme [Azotobacter vinelandii]WKN22488.1 aminotransferase class III-fold pyridoxal phosphate-dependent enzyme [Azotobacter vinelandii]GLK60029.1 class III pyridoxal phosphate-dependent aminotransferase [Azotobacter vinelandii]SFY20454.1 acetylornithine/N-succinyldiaminopimelate aminotransferase [Azotobacter vinelandii]
MREALACMRMMRTLERPSQLFVRGQGSWLWDVEGDAYLDFTQGLMANSLGHCPSVLVGALRRQVDNLINPGAGYYNLGMLKLATRLCQVTDSDQAYFLSSGAEARGAAIRLASKWGQLHRGGAGRIVMVCDGSRGNVQDAPAARYWATAVDKPGTAELVGVPCNDLQALASALDERTVAVMLEPLQGETEVATREYLQAVSRLCNERGLLLILDEVQTGIGRYGALLAGELYDVRADIVTLGTGLGGGMPLAALLARGSACCFEPGDLVGSCHGNALASAAGLAVLDTVLEAGFLEHVRAAGEHLREGLVQLAGRYGHGPLRGRGLLTNLPLAGLPAAAVVEAALKERLLIGAPQAHCLRFSPALTVSHGNIDEMLKRLTRALCRVSGRN